MAKSMFGSGRDFCLTSANTASATASWPDFGAAAADALLAVLVHPYVVVREHAVEVEDGEPDA